MTFNYARLEAEDLVYVEIAPAAEVPSGERLFVEVDGRMIVVFNIAGTYYAIADVCSHDDGPVGEGQLDGFYITCPRHGAGFDVRTGQVTRMPAVVDIPAYPVSERDGMLWIGIPKS